LLSLRAGATNNHQKGDAVSAAANDRASRFRNRYPFEPKLNFESVVLACERADDSGVLQLQLYRTDNEESKQRPKLRRSAWSRERAQWSF
jgi:hypothetical protein